MHHNPEGIRVASGARLGDWFKSVWQYPLPQHAISRFTHWLTRLKHPGFKNWMIRAFIRRFDVDMREAAEPNPDSYPTFNAFFTRALRSGVRSVIAEPEAIACPVDGTVSQYGEITNGRIIQAKDRDFNTRELLGGDPTLAAKFASGLFVTLYLSPRDYHRVHMPFDGILRRMLHVPGRLFSVNPPTTRAVLRLFARNERVAMIFDTTAGSMAVVMVGALNVGSIETVWAGEITPPRGYVLRSWDYLDDNMKFAKGAELGRFNMGSTVILLFASSHTRWETMLKPDVSVRMGQQIGHAT
ncbi:MAG: phosphatidylserine decarboxylase [Gammaproteobacteria bacterium]|nr:phosphatidylserine decarboxylase [Gammaproteobacteria bacterium]